MFDHRYGEVGLSREYLWSGGSHDDSDDRDDHGVDAAYALTCLELAVGWTEPDRHVLPDDLESIPVGPYLSALVGSVDRTRLNGHDAVRLMQTEARLAASLEAAKLATMAEVAYSPAGGPESPVERSGGEVEYAAVEIAAALTLTRRAAERQLETALTLTGRLRRVWQRFASGDIDLAKARELVNQLAHLPEDTIEEVLDATLETAAELTTGQLRARVSRLVMETDPAGAASGFAEGLADRRMVAYPNPDFTALGIQSGDPGAVHRAMTHVDEIAHALNISGEERSLDQIRVDVALDLLAGKCHCGTGPVDTGGVHLKTDIATLAGLADTPGELAGYGPVLADIARKIALQQVDGEWTYTVTDQGKVVGTGTTKRRPTASQRRRIEAEYETCTFVGCRMPAHVCDLDHRRPYSQGGPTHNDNLAPLCRHHHMARHHAPWLLHRLPGGDHQWTSPLGQTYIKPRAPPD